MYLSPDNSRYLRWFTVSFVLGCATAALFNAAVDPYGIFGTPRFAGFNVLKPRGGERVRVAKPYMAERIQARTIIAGNSRAEMGIDPQSPCWNPDHQPVFNIAVPGAGVRQQIEYARHAVFVTGAHRVYLAVDFIDFLESDKDKSTSTDTPVQVAAPDPRLRQSSDHSDRFSDLAAVAQRSKDRLEGLFSLQALVDSIATIAFQQRINAPTRRADGFNPARDYLPIIRTEGQFVLFDQKNKEVAEAFGLANPVILSGGPGSSEPLRALRGFLEWGQRNEIGIQVFINPYHAHYLTLLEVSGLWSLFEQWKREVLKIATSYDTKLWDFSSYDHYSTESPPLAKNTRDKLNWFWEPAHYRSELGDLLIRRIEQTRCRAKKNCGSLGVELSDLNIEAHLAATRTVQAKYLASHPEVRRMLSELLPDPE